MFPAELPWISTPTGAQVQVSQLGLLIVRKVGTSFDVVIFGKALKERSLTIPEGKERAEMAARRWVAQAAEMLWSKDAPKVPEPRRTVARPGGVAKRDRD